MEACAMSVTSCPSSRQGMLELEDLDLDWDSEDLDMCFAGGSRQDNELIKLGRKVVGRLKKALKKR